MSNMLPLNALVQALLLCHPTAASKISALPAVTRGGGDEEQHGSGSAGVDFSAARLAAVTHGIVFCPGGQLQGN